MNTMRHSNKENTTTKQTKKNTNKIDQLKLLTFKREFLKISVELQTTFKPEARLAEEQWLKEQLNMVKLRMFRAGTRMLTISRTEG
jgi:hypothetical protein